MTGFSILNFLSPSRDAPELFRALVNNDKQNALKALDIIKKNPDVVFEIPTSNNPLALNYWHIAAALGRDEVLQCIAWLFPFGCQKRKELVETTASGYTAMYYAAAGGHMSTVQYLHDRFDIHVDVGKDSKLIMCRTALHIAVQCGHIDVVQYLISTGADVNHAMTDGWRAIDIAAYYGNDTACTELVKAEADMSTNRLLWKAPLEIAAANGHLGTLHCLNHSTSFELEVYQKVIEELLGCKLEKAADRFTYEVGTPALTVEEFRKKQEERLNDLQESIRQLEQKVSSQGSELIGMKEEMEVMFADTKLASRQQRLIFADENLARFYLTLCKKLTDYMLACSVIASGLVERKKSKIELAFKSIAGDDLNLFNFLKSLLGSFVITAAAPAILDGIQCLVQLGTTGALALYGKQQEGKIKQVSGLSYSLASIQDIAEGIARRLAIIYQHQLRKLSYRGLDQVALGAFKRILHGVLRDKVSHPGQTVTDADTKKFAADLFKLPSFDPNCTKPGDRIRDKLVSFVCNERIKENSALGKLLFSKVMLDTNLDLSWTVEGFFLGPGIELEKTDCPGEGTGLRFLATRTGLKEGYPSNHFGESAKYGFRLASQQEYDSYKHKLEQVGLTIQTKQSKPCQQAACGAATGSPMSASPQSLATSLQMSLFKESLKNVKSRIEFIETWMRISPGSPATP